jgi:hypothetical protein
VIVNNEPSSEPRQQRGQDIAVGNRASRQGIPETQMRGVTGERSESDELVERDDTGEPLVSITLSRNQIDHVMRASLGEDAPPSVSTLVAGAGFHRSHARQMLSARYRSLQDNRRLSRSLLAGLLVLSCFPPEGMDIGIKDISEQLDLNTSTVHRYVLTLVAAGLLERDPDTRRYRLLPA